MYKFVVFVIFLLPGILYGQKHTFNLEWDDASDIPKFTGSYYPDDPSVPWFFFSTDWSYAGMEPEVSFQVTRSSRLPDKYHPAVSSASFSSPARPSAHLVYEKKRPVLHIRLNPLYRDPGSGDLMRVESFTLQTVPRKPMAVLKSAEKGMYQSDSRLASGDWFKVGVNTTGIHRITYEQLQQLGIQNPASVSIHGAGAILLPENFTDGYYDDLQPVPFLMVKGPDQLFGPGDYLLFFARGPVSWSYNPGSRFWSQQLHPYSTAGYYFITDDLGPGSSPAEEVLSTEGVDFIVSNYDVRAFLEEEKYNLLNSGKTWYGDKYSVNLTGTYPFSLDGLSLSDSLRIRATVAARSNMLSTFDVSANGTLIGSIIASTVNLSSYTSTYAVQRSEIFPYKANQEIVSVRITYNRPNDNSEAWLNHITVNGRANLALAGDELLFRDSRSAGFGNVSEFRLQGAGAKTRIWDVTDPDQPLNIVYSLNGSTASFKLETNDIREFIAFNTDGDFPSPLLEGAGLGRVENQNLHGTAAPDLLIIYHEAFLEQAERLAAHRRINDGLDVLLATQEQVFNEFSSGTPNVAALRNYLKKYYDTGSPDNIPRYLLLFGDGSYDNRETANYNPNLILTYQSDNSLAPTSSYVSDDFYGLLDSGEDLNSGLLDIGIGRLPASTLDEATLLVDKIIAYDSTSTIGEWRNFITFIGDDEDSNIHMRQANSLAEFVEDEYPAYNVNRIFLDAYTQEVTSTGDRYPDVTRAINNQMDRGALIINYTGHGGVTGLAHEKILDLTSIKSWDNEGKWPLFMTATCEFSRYDEYNHLEKIEVSSAGEEVLLNPIGGSIALFTTTRLVYSAPNHELNEQFYNIVFERDENNEPYRLGDIIAFSKNQSSPGINKRNFTLLGDPSMSLSFPKHLVLTDSINSMPVEAFNDTLSALDFVTVSGHITNQQGQVLSGFNGKVTPIVYDKMNNIQTLANDGGNPMDFQARNSILYKGNATVTNGKFSFSFYIPKDINYLTGPGKISYYGTNGTEDAHGSEENFLIGGIGGAFSNDTSGPVIRVFMNDSLFRNGGIVDPSPELLVYVRDEYGINTTGNGIGHDITATLNDDRYNAIVLNEFYQGDTDSYNSGTLRYSYRNLPEGKHTIVVKVWDIFNNSAQESLDFVVVESASMLLEQVYNYPNPFVDQTWFNIEHNRPGEQFEVTIRIYDMNGRLTALLRQNVYSSGYRLEPVSWNGTGFGGATLGGGVYVYQVLVRSGSGEERAGTGRLVIKR
jgi:hypothetical protein